MRKILITLTILGAFAISASAQDHTVSPPPILVTASDNGKPTDGLAGVILSFGPLYIVAYAQNVDIKVNVPDGHGGFVTDGTVVLRVNHKDLPVSYAGPAPFFPNFQQINIGPIPPDEFPAGATVYLRVCDQASNCKNSTGATVRVAP